MATTNVSNYPGNYVIRATGGYVMIYVPNDEVVLDTPFTNITGELLVDKSAEIMEDLIVHRNTTLGDTEADTIDTVAQFINNLIPQTPETYDVGTDSNYWRYAHIGSFTAWGTGTAFRSTITNTENVWNPYPPAPEGRPYDPNDIYGTAEQRQQGALYVYGGVGIEKDLNVGGYIYGRVEIANTTTFVEYTATNVDQEFQLAFIQEELGDQSYIYIDNTGTVSGLTYNPFTGRISTDRMLVAEADNATSTETGVLVVAGGAGIAKDTYIGGNLTVTNVFPQADNTGTIGNTTTQWAEAYVHDLYTRLIQSTTGTITIDPAAGVTDVVGDIRVRGRNPLGTYPVVSNTLYVTMDGNDTNDGRGMDATRACRTITGAVNSPYYQPGTQILVSAGFYLEDNPIRMKPYTSIRGSDIRTTFIEPINKTQDLFHVDSGCYLNYMTFLNGRSGLLQGSYLPEYNRGAYATAFPPLEGDEKIDLYHSPYIQNCTNQSGPWLYDGTMFVPNQTVQIPAAAGRYIYSYC
jgi:hypothetical protein